jgi:hypothetical protein
LLPTGKGKQVNDLHLQRPGKTLQPGDGGGIDAAFEAADELHRPTDRFGKLHLRQSPLQAKFRDPLAKFLLEHGGQIPNLAAQSNATVVRVSICQVVKWAATPGVKRSILSKPRRVFASKPRF